MRAYPEPKDAIRRIDAERAIVQADAHGAEAADVLEVQGAVSRIGLQQVEALVCQGANSTRQCLITLPEPW